MKKPWLAALLNVIPLGAGYLYLGAWTRFVQTLLLGISTPFIGIFLGPVILDSVVAGLASECGSTFSPACPRPWWAYLVIMLGLALPPVLLAWLTARGAYGRAVSQNAGDPHDYSESGQGP